MLSNSEREIYEAQPSVRKHRIKSQSKWYCDDCDEMHDLAIVVPEDKSDPYVYLHGIHVHVFGALVELPDMPVRISFNDRLRISEHVDEDSVVLEEDC